jgi:hypothetical protein
MELASAHHKSEVTYALTKKKNGIMDVFVAAQEEEKTCHEVAQQLKLMEQRSFHLKAGAALELLQQKPSFSNSSAAAILFAGIGRSLSANECSWFTAWFWLDDQMKKIVVRGEL